MKKHLLTTASILLCISLLLSSCAQDNLRTVSVAYACTTELSDQSPDSAIGYVSHKIINASGERLYLLTLQLALYDPGISGLVSPFPEGLIINSIKVDDEKVAHVTFSDSYLSLDGMSKTLADSCTLYTLIQFPEITAVSISAKSSPETETLVAADDFVTDVSGLHLVNYNVVFYYPDEKLSSLTPVPKTLTLSQTDSLTEKIVEELIAGYSDSSVTRYHIAQDSQCLSAAVKGRVCYVNMSEEFLTLDIKKSGSESLTIYSIVNTLCGLEDVDKVQFLVNGETRRRFNGTNISSPFEPDYSLMHN